MNSCYQLYFIAALFFNADWQQVLSGGKMELDLGITFTTLQVATWKLHTATPTERLQQKKMINFITRIKKYGSPIMMTS